MDEAIQLSSASAVVVFVPEEAGVIWRIARQLSLHDVLLKALDVLLEGERRNNSKTFAHPAVRLLLAAVASRIRC